MKETHLKSIWKGQRLPSKLSSVQCCCWRCSKGQGIFWKIMFSVFTCWGAAEHSTQKHRQEFMGLFGETALSRQVPAVLWEHGVSTGRVRRISLLCSCVLKAAELLQQDTGGFQLCSLWRAGISHTFLYCKAKWWWGRLIWGFGRTGSIFGSWGCFLTGKHSL